MADSYITDVEASAILAELGVTLAAEDIGDYLLKKSKQRLDKLTGRTWGVLVGSQYIDGMGHNTVFSPRIPIVTLTSVVVINKDTTETTYDIAGTDRQLWYDEETGRIEIIRWGGDPAIVVSSPSTYFSFPKGVRNVKITGTFGEEADDTVKLTQTLLFFKLLSMMNPKEYATNMVMEKIGNYQYKLGDGVKFTSFDECLNSLVEDLTGAEGLGLEEI